MTLPSPGSAQDEFFRLTADAAPALVWVCDAEGTYTYFNQRWLDFRGRAAAQEVGTGWYEGIHPDDLARRDSEISEPLAQREPYQVQYRLRRADGDYRWVLERGSPQFGHGNAFIGYVGSCVDVSEEVHDRDELREAEDRLTFAVESGQMGEWSFSTATGNIGWSPTMERLCGLEPGSFNGTLEGALAVIHPEDVDMVRQHIERAVVDPEAQLTLVYRVVAPTGEVRWLDTRAQPIDAERREWIGVAIDVTRRQRAEAELRDTVTGLDTVLEHAPVGFAFFDRDFSFVHLNEPLAQVTGLPIEAHVGRTIQELLPDIWTQIEAVLARVVESGQPALDIDVIAQMRGEPGVERHFLTSFYPVNVDGVAAGFGALLVDITEHRRSEIQAQLLAELSELLAAEQTIEAIVEAAVRIPIPDLADACTLYLRPTEVTGPLAVVAHVDPDLEVEMSKAFKHHGHEDADEPVSDVLRQGRSLRVELVTPEMRNSPAVRPDDRALIDGIGVNSFMAVPITHGDTVLGTFAFLSTESKRRFQPSDLEIGEQLAGRIGLAVDNARLAMIAALAQTRLQLLARAGEIVTEKLDSGARLRRLTDLLVPDFADLAAVHVAGPDDTLELLDVAFRDHASQDTDDELYSWPPMPVADNPAPTAVAFETGEPVLLPEIPPDLIHRVRGASVAGAPRRLGITSALAMPLQVGDESLGSFTICYTDSGRRYSEHDVPLVSEVARRVALSALQARTFEEEHETAALLQLSLLPDRLPQIPGLGFVARYLPGSAGLAVGGDWYDVVPLDDGSVVLVIGDVVGHGIAAAASMGRLRSALQLSAIDGDSPSRILDRLNAYLARVGTADMATVLVARLSLRPLSITVATAGHPPVAVVPPAGPCYLIEVAPGPPIGATERAQYEETHVELEMGTSLVLYTDGLIERRGESLDVGLDRLCATLDRQNRRFFRYGDLEALGDVLLGELEAMGREDDVALLCAGVLPAGAGFEFRLPADARELATARHAIGTWLDSRGASRTEEADITLAVNEALANAVAHAYGLRSGDVEVEARDEDGSVVFVVRDEGRWADRHPDSGGRGIQMMKGLMDDVTIDSAPDGTTVTLRRRLRRAQ
jgi:PAS domain S-box-containing protein